MAIEKYEDKIPKIDDSCYIANSADIIGEVTIGEGSSIWYGAVIRGDIAPVYIGDNTSIQDNCTVHVNHGMPAAIGNNVTVGHNAVIHGAKVHDNCLIGMGAVILDNAVIGSGSVVGAGSVVKEGEEIPPNSLVVGIPAKVVKTMDDEREDALIQHALSYAVLAENYLRMRE